MLVKGGSSNGPPSHSKRQQIAEPNKFPHNFNTCCNLRSCIQYRSTWLIIPSAGDTNGWKTAQYTTKAKSNRLKLDDQASQFQAIVKILDVSWKQDVCTPDAVRHFVFIL